MNERGAVVILNAASFDAEIACGTVLVDFWAQWCGPCHALTHVLSDLAAEASGAKIAKIDVSEHPEIGERFGVTSLPTIILFRDGTPAKRMFGAKNRRQLIRAISDVTEAHS